MHRSLYTSPTVTAKFLQYTTSVVHLAGIRAENKSTDSITQQFFNIEQSLADATPGKYASMYGKYARKIHPMQAFSMSKILMVSAEIFLS